MKKIITLLYGCVIALLMLVSPPPANAQGTYTCYWKGGVGGDYCELLAGEYNCEPGYKPIGKGCSIYSTKELCATAKHLQCVPDSSSTQPGNPANQVGPVGPVGPIGPTGPQAPHFVNFGQILGGIPGFKFAGGTTGEVIGEILKYLLVIAGFLLLLYLIYGGFQLMTSAGNPDKTKGAREIITRAVVGFVVIFVAYWVIQIVGTVFGITEIRDIFK
ncbi:hypothetical protein HYZ78_01950 [Candidatus Microgenomates bacterium]|nr:hypothetical protein [Candidatus Microgenomates bacterium]